MGHDGRGWLNMSSQRLWHFLAVLGVIGVVFTVGVQRLFFSQSDWQKVSATSLSTQIEKGLTQVRWQWQQDGRPSQLIYSPSNTNETYEIEMMGNGKPKVDASIEGCEKFLSWFVDKETFNKLVNVTTQKVKEVGQTSKLCQFNYVGYTFTYDITQGEFTFL